MEVIGVDMVCQFEWLHFYCYLTAGSFGYRHLYLLQAGGEMGESG